MYVNEARARGGTIPCINAKVYEVARRLLRMEYNSDTSTHTLVEETDAYLQLAGFDPKTLHITDYDKFDQWMASSEHVKKL
jgi:hypothetical protein